MSSKQDDDMQLNEDGTVSMGVQTAFRESEAQTDPFTPDAIIPEGTAPELARLAFLRFGGENGRSLPVGRAEIEAVEEDRAKAAIQKALPPMTDESNFTLRKRLMENLELISFARKEADIDAENDTRLGLVSAALEARQNERELIAEQRVEKLRRTLAQETSKELTDISGRRMRTLRKLGQAKSREHAHIDMLTGTGTFSGVATGKHHGAAKPTRDIIADYSDPSSRVYAPLAREGLGRHLDKLSVAATMKVNLPTGAVTGLQTSTTLPASTFNVRVGGSGLAAARGASAKVSLKKSSGGVDRPSQARADAADAALGENLERIWSMITTVRAGLSTAAVENEPVPAWRVPKPDVQRPSTPSFDDMDEPEEAAQLEAAVSLLQTLFRGRAVQNAMLAGTERRLELIREMRVSLITDAEAAELDAQDNARAHASMRSEAVEAAVDTAAGEITSAALDFFAKELVRSQEMARISALAAAADAERARRESAEQQRRWAETHARTLETAYATSAAEILADTADKLVRACVGSAVASLSHFEAGRTTKLVVSVLRPIVERLENEGTDLTQGLGLADRPEDFPAPHLRWRYPELADVAGLERPGLDSAAVADGVAGVTEDGGEGEGQHPLDTSAHSLCLSEEGELAAEKAAAAGLDSLTLNSAIQEGEQAGFAVAAGAPAGAFHQPEGEDGLDLADDSGGIGEPSIEEDAGPGVGAGEAGPQEEAEGQVVEVDDAMLAQLAAEQDLSVEGTEGAARGEARQEQDADVEDVAAVTDLGEEVAQEGEQATDAPVDVLDSAAPVEQSQSLPQAEEHEHEQGGDQLMAADGEEGGGLDAGSAVQLEGEAMPEAEGSVEGLGEGE